MIRNILVISLLIIEVVRLEKMAGLLLYEDQMEEICNSMDCWNALTLKNKLYDSEMSMEDFTLCFRLNLLSYRAKGNSHTILRAKTNKYVLNEDMNQFWTTGFHFELIPTNGPGNGVITIQTFNDRLQEVLSKDGVYTIWPEYKTEVNANQWNSFCIGSNLRDRRIFLTRNGETVYNFSQPQVWADVNVGLDTTALEPFQVK